MQDVVQVHVYSVYTEQPFELEHVAELEFLVTSVTVARQISPKSGSLKAVVQDTQTPKVQV